MFKKFVAISLVSIFMLFIAGCPAQQTAASLWKEAGVLADAYLNVYYPNWENRKLFDDTWTKVGDEIATWKTGTPCGQIVEGINTAAALLAALPVLDEKAQLLMAAIVVAIDGTAAFYPQCAPPTTLKAVHRQQFSPVIRAKADTLPVPKNAGDLDKLWKQLGGPKK